MAGISNQGWEKSLASQISQSRARVAPGWAYTADTQRTDGRFASRRLRILCVDDDRDTADSLGMLLQLLRYDVRVCYDGEEALKTAKMFRPHACILDYQMPQMNGCELACKLRNQAKTRPPLLVAASAHGSDGVRRRTAAAGFHLHLVKPFDVAALPAAFVRLDRAQWRG